MMLENMILENVKNMPPSGIRKYFDMVHEMEGVISLGVGTRLCNPMECP